MLNLATNALESEISREGGSICLVLGFGEMGCKAVETLISLNQSKIYVISRSPDEAKLRNQEIASQVSILTLDEWQKLDIEPTLVISTIRNNQATYNQSNPLPVSNPATVMDFSWPPQSIPMVWGVTKHYSEWITGLELHTRWERNGITHQYLTDLN